MLEGLGYTGVSLATSTWLDNLSPIVLLIAGIALALSFASLGLRLFGIRGSESSPDGRDSSPTGLDKRIH